MEDTQINNTGTEMMLYSHPDLLGFEYYYNHYNNPIYQCDVPNSTMYESPLCKALHAVEANPTKYLDPNYGWNSAKETAWECASTLWTIAKKGLLSFTQHTVSMMAEAPLHDRCNNDHVDPNMRLACTAIVNGGAFSVYNGLIFQQPMNETLDDLGWYGLIRTPYDAVIESARMLLPPPMQSYVQTTKFLGDIVIGHVYDVTVKGVPIWDAREALFRSTIKNIVCYTVENAYANFIINTFYPANAQQGAPRPYEAQGGWGRPANRGCYTIVQETINSISGHQVIGNWR